MAKEVPDTEHCRAGSVHAEHRAVAARVAHVASGSGDEIAREACETAVVRACPQTSVYDGSGGALDATQTARCERWAAQAFLGAVRRDADLGRTRLVGQWHPGRPAFCYGRDTKGVDPTEVAQPDCHDRHRADRTGAVFGSAH